MSEGGRARRLASDRRPLAATAVFLLNWAAIVGTFALVAHDPSWPVFVIGFLFIAVEQHCLGLWMHEGGHYLIASDRTLNDFLVTLFLSGPLYVPLNPYRSRHLLHHGHLGTERDTKPVIFTRVDGRHFGAFFLKNCLGLQLIEIVREYFGSPRATPVKDGSRWVKDVLAMLVVQVLLFGLIASVAPWHYYVWLWLLPWLTVNRFVAGLRSVVEHQPMRGEAHPFVRPLKPSVFDRLVFCRAGFEYHWLHHRHPNVPCFNLHKLDDAVPDASARLSYTAVLLLLVQGAASTLGMT
jgi:fatty acid desaturase